MAMPSGSRTASQTTPARPSISPLSVASKTLKSSPIATRDSTVHDIEAQFNSEMGGDNADPDAEDDAADDRSSSLSEPDDDEDEEGDDVNGRDDHDGEEEEESIRARRDLEVDSEAETERLDQTPQKARKQAEALGRTPSKLSQAATAEDELSDPPSPLPAGVGAASSTSTIATAGLKRKRSDTADSPLTSAESDIEESPRKRHEVEEENTAEEDVDMATEDNDPAESTPAPDPTTVKATRGRKPKRKGPHKKVEEQDLAIAADDTPEPNESSEPTSDATKLTDPVAILARTEALALYNLAAQQFRAYREQDLSERLAALATDLETLSQPNPTHSEYLRQTAAVDARHAKQVREAHAHYNLRLRSLRDRTLGERSQLFSQFYQSVREVREEALYSLGEDWYAIQKERRGADEAIEEQYLYKFPANKKERVRLQRKYNREVEVLSGVAKWVGWPGAPELEEVGDEAREGDWVAMGLSKRLLPQTLGRPPPQSLPPAAISSRTAIPTAAPRLTPAPPLYLSGNGSQPTPPSTSIFAHTANNAQDERIAHEQYLERNAWARPPPPGSLIHHSLSAGHGHGHGGTASVLGSGMGLGVGAHTADWAEPTGRVLGREGRFGGGFGAGSPLGGTADAAHGRLTGEDGLGSSPAGKVTPIPKGRFDEGNRNGSGFLGGESGWRNFSNLSGASTIDAPITTGPEREQPEQWGQRASPGQNHARQTHEQDQPQGPAPRPSDAVLHSPHKAALAAHSPPGPHAFDPAHLYRRPMEPGRDAYPGVGAFGTPTPGPRGGVGQVP